MKNIKTWIMTLVIMLILLTSLVIVINKNVKENTVPGVAEEKPQDTPIVLDGKVEKETNENVFFSIEKHINNLNIENMSRFYAQEMYGRITKDNSEYYIGGIAKIAEGQEEKLGNAYMKAEIDNNSNTIQISNLTKEEYEMSITDESKGVNKKTIEKTEDNAYNINLITPEECAMKYMQDYAIKLKFNKEKAYDMLDSEYKLKKFNNNIEEFKQYAYNNQERFDNLTVKSYAKNLEENQIRYIIIDSYDNYYIIKRNAVLDYTILLDSYTVETPEYLKAYNEAKEEVKISTNISKVIKLLNEKSYSQVYNVLDNEFKNNNFNTLESFEKYLSEHFYKNNIATIEKVEKVSGVYVCSVNIKSGIGLSAQEMQKKFVIKLGEGTNFTISFEI